MLKRVTKSINKRNLVWFCIHRKKQIKLEQENKNVKRENKNIVLNEQ